MYRQAEEQCPYSDDISPQRFKVGESYSDKLCLLGFDAAMLNKFVRVTNKGSNAISALKLTLSPNYRNFAGT